MTMAQQLEQRGRLKGWQEGFKKALREGVQKTSLKIWHNLMKTGMDIQFVIHVTGLTEEKQKQVV